MDQKEAARLATVVRESSLELLASNLALGEILLAFLHATGNEKYKLTNITSLYTKHLQSLVRR